jgi:hypothetical protein
MPRRSGLVARLVNDEELLINIGSEDGVVVGQLYKVLDPITMNVPDPATGRDLGSIERVKAQVVVTEVGERLALARKWPRRKKSLSGAASVLSGESNLPRPSTRAWREGVAPKDPVVATGKRIVHRAQDGQPADAPVEED